MERAEIAALLAREGLDAEAILAHAHVELRITATRDDDPPLGRSRLGGAPDLPAGTAWPRHRWSHTETRAWEPWHRRDLATAIALGRVIDEGDRVALALGFVAQLDLAELARHVAPPAAWPREGHVLLFADQGTHAGEVAGYPVVASACLYAPPGTPLERTPSPPVADPIAPAVLAFTPALALPDPSELALDAAAWDRYARVLQACQAPAPRHAVFGEAVNGSIELVPPPSYISLLRVDTDDALDTHWGDAAWLDFAARADAPLGEVHAFRWIG